MATYKSLTGFNTIGERIHLYRPSATVTTTSGPLDLIVLCTWVAARYPNIQKYAATHQRLYPGAMILIIESSISDMLARSTRSQIQRFQPAVDVIIPYFQRGSETETSRVLLHMFSNGGLTSASRLLGTLPEQGKEGLWAGVVYDSTPGQISFWRSIQAMKLSVPPSLFWRTVGLVIIYATVTLVMIVELSTGMENVVTVGRRKMNDVDLVAAGVPRLYLYSKADQLVSWEDVVLHVEDARRRGARDVKEVRFEDSKHCAHVVQHGHEYWTALQDLVERPR